LAFIEDTLGVVIAKRRNDLVPAILQRFSPGDEQRFIVGNLKYCVAFRDWLPRLLPVCRALATLLVDLSQASHHAAAVEVSGIG